MSASALPWWQQPPLRGELDAVLSLLNEARQHVGYDEERVARKLCDALNRTWNARAQVDAITPRPSDWQLLKALTRDLAQDDALLLLRSDELRDLLAIEPPILDHSKLLARGIVGSREEIPERVAREAAEAHLKLRRLADSLTDSAGAEQIHRGLDRLAALVYVIRSNLQHGQKFADHTRIRRDRHIAEKAAALLELLFDFHFARPTTALAAYGSLAPGGAHHSELDRVGGEWIAGVVRGEIVDGTLPRLAPTPAANEVPVQLLRHAEGLPERWQRLDELEGNAYRRVLVATDAEDGAVAVANLYAA